MGAFAVVSEVVTGATALAGLILVYLGSIVAFYDSYSTEQQDSVRMRFRWRAWIAFIGMALSILTAAIAIVGKWFDSTAMVSTAAILLLIVFAWGIFLALLTVLEIR